MIACVDSDAENIFITLSARELRSEILIIARASAEDSEKKLLRAGADRVISPYKTSGSEMARVALHPQVGGAVQVADYRMEEIEVPAACRGRASRSRRCEATRDRRPAPHRRPARAPARAELRGRRRATCWWRSAPRRRSSASRAGFSRLPAGGSASR